MVEFRGKTILSEYIFVSGNKLQAYLVPLYWQPTQAAISGLTTTSPNLPAPAAIYKPTNPVRHNGKDGWEYKYEGLLR